jgi:polysaccharide biosynthesis protein PslG
MRKLALASALLMIAVVLLTGSFSVAVAQRPDPAAAQVPERALQRDQLRAGSMPSYSAPVQSGAAASSTLGVPIPREKIGLGIADVWVHSGSTPDTTTLKKAKDVGAGWMLGWVSWSNVEPSEGQFAWNRSNDLDNVANGGSAYGLKVLARIEGIPAWATTDGSGRLSQVDPSKVEKSMKAIAARGKGRVAAYQIFNEPNLWWEWGGTVDGSAPAKYAELLRAAYRGIKAGDRGAIVVSAGLASGAYGESMDDLVFFRGMYAAGARGGTHFDAAGTHPYGGPFAHDQVPEPYHPMHFRRAEAQRAIMVEYKDSKTPMWATEVGWLHGTTENMGPFEWMKVTPGQQADYLVGAFEYAEANWPWMARMFVFNHDHSTAMWCGPELNHYIGPCYPPSTSVYWYSILNSDRSPRPAYTALQQMPKSDGNSAPTPTATPTAVTPTATATATATSTPTPTPTATPNPIPTVAPQLRFTSLATVSPSVVSAGGRVGVAAEVSASAAATVLVVVGIRDPSGREVVSREYKQQGFTAGQTRTYSFNWNVPRNAAAGTYSVRVAVFSANRGTQHHDNEAAGSFVVQR